MKRILFMMLLAVSSICLAPNAMAEIDDEIMSQIIANENECVQKIESEKIYLKPEKIFPTEQGIFLNTHGSNFVHLSNVSSDSQGCFIGRSILNRCPWCNKPYFIKCKNPQCSGKPK